MRIKKFNESVIKKDSPFTNWEMMEKLIEPIFDYDWSISYKLYTMYGDDVSPTGPKHTKNFSDTKFWDVFTEDPLMDWANAKIHSCIIDINTPIFNAVTMDERRIGRPFSNFNSEILIKIIEDIDRIKEDCITEGYTLSVFIQNDGYDRPTNFNPFAQISILILDGIFK